MEVKVTAEKNKREPAIGNNSGSIEESREVCMQHREFLAMCGASNDVTAIFVT